MQAVFNQHLPAGIMKILVQLESQNGYVCFHPVEECMAGEAAKLISEAISLACDQGVKKLLVNIYGLTGFDPPPVHLRFVYADGFAAAATTPIKFVLVCRPELIHEDRLGVLVARNRGLWCNIFASESEALDWLLDPKGR
jgi:hypothetical protein